MPYCDSRCNLLFLQALLLSQQPGVSVPVVHIYTHTHTHIYTYTSCVSAVAQGQIAGLTLVNPAVQNNINVNAQPTARQVETPEAAGKAPISSAVGQPGESSVARCNVKAYVCTAGCACSQRNHDAIQGLVALDDPASGWHGRRMQNDRHPYHAETHVKLDINGVCWPVQVSR